MRRHIELISGEYYHIFNKSIAGFRIFNNQNEYQRLWNTIRYYQLQNPMPLSDFLMLQKVQRQGFECSFVPLAAQSQKLVEIIAYCIMPTHFHLILRQVEESGISDFMRLVLNSYARYFNLKYKRKGPLWQNRFRSVLVESDEQMYHLTRYLHLNPVVGNLARKPEDWHYSSYAEYIGTVTLGRQICCFKDILIIDANDYRKFVSDQIGYQRELGFLKNFTVE